MKLHLVLLGIFLVCTFQLISAKPGWDDDDGFMSESVESEEPDDHGDHADHHRHHQFVKNPFEDQGKAKAAPEAIGTGSVNSNPNQMSEPQKAAPLAAGTNVSGFDEPCNSSRICNTAKELQCVSSNNTCQCTGGFVYVRQTEGCLIIIGNKDARGVLSTDCQYDVQCQYGKWGTYSRCEPATKRCQCNSDAHFIDDTCLLNRTHGDICVTDKQCNATIAGEAVCNLIPGSSGNTKACDCADDHVWDNAHKKCLKIPIPEKAYNFECKSDLQCQRSSLGNDSRCVNEDLQCKCHNFRNPEEDAVVYKNICYPRKRINDTCTETIQCEASMHNAVCEPHQSYNNEKVCHCPSGKKCEDRKNSAMGIFASEMSIATLTCVAVASVFFGRLSIGQTNVI